MREFVIALEEGTKVVLTIETERALIAPKQLVDSQIANLITVTPSMFQKA